MFSGKKPRLEKVEPAQPITQPDERLYAFRLAWRIQEFEKKYGSLSAKQKRFVERRLRDKLAKLKMTQEGEK